MSDPVTNVEIEDVLSSIRKLVADDARVAPAKPKPQADKLVLTPAQRVPGDTTEPNEDPVAEAPSEPETYVEQSFEDIPGDAKLSDFGEVSGAFPDIEAFEAERSQTPDPSEVELDEPARVDKLDLSQLIEREVAAALGNGDTANAYGDTAFEDEPSIDEDTLRRDEMETDIASEFDPVSAEAGTDETDEESPQLSEGYEQNASDDISEPLLTLEDKVAALGRLVARDTTQEFEEERDTPNADELTSTSEKMSWPEDVSFEDEDVSLEDADIPAEVENTSVEDDSASFEDSVASMQDEGVSADVEDAIEPEKPSIVVRPETAWFVHADAADASVEAEVNDAPVEEALSDGHEEVDTPAFGAATEPVPDTQPLDVPTVATATPALQIDEDMLRGMVADIVREELQGALGERITRNVRKLVRREIHRMLVSQELE